MKLLLLLCTSLCYADTIYQYTDAMGHTVYTNKIVAGAKVVKLAPLNIISMVNMPANNSSNSELQRNKILTSELKHEVKALSDAQQALQISKKISLNSENQQQYKLRIQALQDSITEHKKNITILSQQVKN